MTAARETSGGRPSLFVFEAARAIAALTVLLAHARSFVLLDAKDQGPLSWPAQLFYGVSGLGHQAVIVFFVVSGTLVTRSLLGLHRSGRWSMSGFAVPRLTRLWVVLLPCLIIGGVLDRCGEAIGDQLVYAGHYGALRVGGPPIAIRLDAPTFLGNLTFLQTIVVPPYGSNVPLWSLANEAWYYAAAFLVFAMVRDRHRPFRVAVAAAVLFGIAACVMTRGLWLLAPAWAVGAVLALLIDASASTASTRSARAASLVVLAIVVAAARLTAVRHQIPGDYALALATGFALFTHRSWPGWAGAAGWGTRAVARMSYSLYLSHFPLLAFLAAVGLRNERLAFGGPGLVRLTGLLLAALGHAAAIWWLCERRTGVVRAWIEDRMAGRGTGRPASVGRTSAERTA